MDQQARHTTSWRWCECENLNIQASKQASKQTKQPHSGKRFSKAKLIAAQIHIHSIRTSNTDLLVDQYKYIFHRLPTLTHDHEWCCIEIDGDVNLLLIHTRRRCCCCHTKHGKFSPFISVCILRQIPTKSSCFVCAYRTLKGTKVSSDLVGDSHLLLTTVCHPQVVTADLFTAHCPVWATNFPSAP